MKLSDFPPHVQKRIQQDNPDVFGNGLDTVETKVSKPDQGRKGQDSTVEAGENRMAYRVSLVILSRRAMDPHDNLPFSLKQLADAIAESLGRDDAEITWEYGWVKTSGQQGVLVKIEA